MKLRRTWVLLIPLLLPLAVGTSMYSAEPENGQEASEDAAPKPDAQIARWISQLGSDEFKVRDQATQALTKAGLKALPAVLKATQSKQVEVRNRAFVILFAHSTSNDKPTANAVLRAVEEILKSKDRRRVAQAKRILEYPKVRTKLAIAAIKKLGGSVSIESRAVKVGDKIFIGNRTFVNLDHTKVTDADLKHIEALTNVYSVSILETKVSDAGLEHLKGLTKLKTLRFDSTNLTDAGLKHLKGLTNLQTLWLNDTKVTDAGLEYLKGMKSLQSLGLKNTNVTDAGLKHLKGLANFRILMVDGCNVTDAGLEEHLKGMTKLKLLSLRDTKVTKAGVKKLQQALPKCRIYH